jgi:hypothetical protein
MEIPMPKLTDTQLIILCPQPHNATIAVWSCRRTSGGAARKAVDKLIRAAR